jgi:F0F1-type ATP synthase assembly protein I
MKDDDHGKMDYLKEYAKYSSLVFQMIAIVAVGVWGGIELDRLLHIKSPVFTICLTLLSASMAIYYLFKTLLKK